MLGLTGVGILAALNLATLQIESRNRLKVENIGKLVALTTQTRGHFHRHGHARFVARRKNAAAHAKAQAV